ncbi:signal peptidase complex subunit 3 isoform X1 [Hydra vulgaris]|uniref:Signal peptidase complex subunit 3 n=1 Tax=Hydra vulgaris TaxID=6087 RepID=T2MEX0_HYDVU|nr:signal peptidase complex subunit 3 [Hydra vulgaris]
MHTVLSRLNVVFAYCLSVLGAITVGCFLSTYILLPYHEPNVSYAVSKQLVKHVRDFTAVRAKNDMGFLKFNLKSDLEPLFNWNVKQLFLYLTAEYKTKSNELNQVVLWDKIIKRGENAYLDLQDMNSKYYFFDDGAGLKGHKNITLTLSWNLIPNAGILPRIRAPDQFVFSFPDTYVNS